MSVPAGCAEGRGQPSGSPAPGKGSLSRALQGLAPRQSAAPFLPRTTEIHFVLVKPSQKSALTGEGMKKMFSSLTQLHTDDLVYGMDMTKNAWKELTLMTRQETRPPQPALTRGSAEPLCRQTRLHRRPRRCHRVGRGLVVRISPRGL